MSNPGTDGHQPKLWFYRLRATDGKDFEWAEVVIGSNGFFAAVSDYGNYSFRWTHFGDDFRQFVLGIGPDYVHGKIMGCSGRRSEVYDEAATLKGVRKSICALRRSLTLTREEARDAFEELKWDFAELYTSSDLERWGMTSSFMALCARRRIDFDLYEGVYKKMPEPQSWMFCERILARLKDAIRAELAAEAVVAVQP